MQPAFSETIDVKRGVRLRVDVVYDTEDREPDNICRITYRADGRNVLGNTPVTQDQYNAIAEGLNDGTYIGLPVFAYVHSGATIRAAERNPFACPWDSGRSGWAYVTPKQAEELYGLTDPDKVIEAIIQDVKEFDSHLTGDVYGVTLTRIDTDAAGDETEEEIDSLWGLVGYDYAKATALDDLAVCAKRIRETEPEQLEINIA